jgi:hypothetical protein
LNFRLWIELNWLLTGLIDDEDGKEHSGFIEGEAIF